MSGVIAEPVTESVPAIYEGSAQRNIRVLLIGIVIFAAIGMGVTLALIIILRKSGYFPARSKPRHRAL